MEPLRKTSCDPADTKERRGERNRMYQRERERERERARESRMCGVMVMVVGGWGGVVWGGCGE